MIEDLVVQTEGLRKHYRERWRRVPALDGLDLEVGRGQVHGFLGPNGSGKTTTLRILLGLARADAGSARLFAQPGDAPLPSTLARVGAVVGEPRFSPDLTARRNLTLLARAGRLPLDRVDAALERVGLGTDGRTRLRHYSTGMWQRLGVASALLKEPELLILDEPGRGLDPAGIRSLRDLVRELAEAGTTVLLSSHILAEVQQLCTSVTIIDAGRRVTSGTVPDLLGEQVSRTRVGVSEPARAEQTLTDAGFRVAADPDGTLVIEGHDNPQQITRLLAESGLYVTELSAVRPDLEEVFLRLTGAHSISGAEGAVQDTDEVAS